MRLIALKEVKYADVIRKPGDEFDASAEDSRLLIGWEKAKAADDGSGDGLFAKGESSEAGQQGRSSRRQYRRRDMVSEG